MANPFFDAEYYLEKNADVAAVVGDDAEAAEAHYLAHGAAEGRKPAQWFDAEYYQSSNSDLAGLSADQLFAHFAAYGVNELRSPAEGFELDAATFQAYADENEDLVEALGIEDAANLTDADVAALASHFFEFGIYEDRPGAPELPAEPTDLSELTAALETYQDAVDAKDEFLEEAAESDVIEAAIDDGAFDPAADDLEDFIAEDLIEWAKSELNTDGVNNRTAYDFETVTDNALPAMIADVKAEFAENLTEATTEINKKAGLKNAVDAVKVAGDRVTAATEVLADVTITSDAEMAKFNALQDPAGAFDFVADPGTVAEGGDVVVNLITVGARGKLVAHESIEDDLPEGFAALLAEAQKLYNADRTLDQRELAFANAEDRVDDLVTEATTGANPIWADVPTAEAAIDAYIEAALDVEEFNEAVEIYEGAQELVADLDANNETLDAAVTAIEELGYEVQEFDPVTFVAVGTEANDAFVYIADEDSSIDFFGEVGDDVLFIGTEFSYNDDIENGNDSALEVFFTQDGADVVVTIEQVAFGSNASTPEVDTITLTGVNVEDIHFADGYVQLV